MIIIWNLPQITSLEKIIIEHLKHNKFQFYVIPDRKIPIKASIRDLPISADIEEIKGNLIFKGFTLTKISQFQSSRDNKNLLPLFQVEFLKNEISNEFYALKTLFETRTDTEKIRATIKSVQWHHSIFFHIASNCNMDLY